MVTQSHYLANRVQLAPQEPRLSMSMSARLAPTLICNAESLSRRIRANACPAPQALRASPARTHSPNLWSGARLATSARKVAQLPTLWATSAPTALTQIEMT